jgi:hypothetical protein
VQLPEAPVCLEQRLDLCVFKALQRRQSRLLGAPALSRATSLMLDIVPPLTAHWRENGDLIGCAKIPWRTRKPAGNRVPAGRLYVRPAGAGRLAAANPRVAGQDGSLINGVPDPRETGTARTEVTTETTRGGGSARARGPRAPSPYRVGTATLSKQVSGPSS